MGIRENYPLGPGGCEATARPIWGIQERRIIVTGGGWDWDSDSEKWFRDEDQGGDGKTDEEVLELDPDSCFVFWDAGGALSLWLNREDAEEWLSRHRYRYSGAARVYCYAIEQGCHLARELGEENRP